jgi:hypothetical protein
MGFNIWRCWSWYYFGEVRRNSTRIITKV